MLAEMKQHGGTTLALRKRLAAKTYARTAAYDAAISSWYADQLGDNAPHYRALGGKLRQPLRYGENPHQNAAFYVTGEKRFGVATAKQLQGKELSYNNLNDTDAAYELVAEFDPNEASAVAIIKHANPCGVATGASLLEAYKKALECDSVSAFGGMIALNKKLDKATAEAIAEIFTEVVIAPDADEDAVAVFAKKKNLRLLVAGGLPDPATPGLYVKTVAGGFLAQNRDNGRVTAADLKIVTKKKPSDAQIRDMLFAFRVAKHVKSNAIVYAKDAATVGIGAGQMSRVDSARVARLKAEDAAHAAGGERSQDDRQRVRVGRILPVPGRPAASGASGLHRGDPARRLDPRRRRDQGGRRSRARHGVHRNAPLPALAPPHRRIRVTLRRHKRSLVPREAAMVRYQVRMMDSGTGAEGVYVFEHREDLMQRPADDIVAAFFDYADREIFNRGHVAYELNGVVKNKKQGTAVAIGSMYMNAERGEEDLQPFTLFIAKA